MCLGSSPDVSPKSLVGSISRPHPSSCCPARSCLWPAPISTSRQVLKLVASIQATPRPSPPPEVELPSPNSGERQRVVPSFSSDLLLCRDNILGGERGTLHFQVHRISSIATRVSSCSLPTAAMQTPSPRQPTSPFPSTIAVYFARVSQFKLFCRRTFLDHHKTRNVTPHFENRTQRTFVLSTRHPLLLA